MTGRVLTVAQVADMLQVRPRTVQRWIAERGLRAIAPGGRDYRILEADLDTWLEQQATTAPAGTKTAGKSCPSSARVATGDEPAVIAGRVRRGRSTGRLAA